jgi:hypothetical protein
MINETNDGQCLKNDASFALLVKVSSHMVIMFDEINNLVRLNVTLQGTAIGLWGQSRSQSKSICQTNFGEGNNRWPNNP